MLHKFKEATITIVVIVIACYIVSRADDVPPRNKHLIYFFAAFGFVLYLILRSL